MLRALRSALVRFTVRRAAASQRDAPRRADWWLRLGCTVSPAFGECYPALVRLRRAIEDRWGAVAAAQDAAERFSENPDAWMLLGEAFQMVFRQHDARHHNVGGNEVRRVPRNLRHVPTRHAAGRWRSAASRSPRRARGTHRTT